MDRDELDEIMQEYVKSTNGDVNKDLAKLDLSRFEESKARARAKSRQNKMWAGIAAMVVLIIALSVALPLTLSKNPEGSTIYYFSINNVEREKIDTKQDLMLILSDDIILTDLNCIEEVMWCLKANGTIIGAYIDNYVYDDKVDTILSYIVLDNVELDLLVDYIVLPSNYEWNGLNIQYSVVEDTTFLTKNYKMIFNANGFNHYYTITSGLELEIGELLDWVFG